MRAAALFLMLMAAVLLPADARAQADSKPPSSSSQGAAQHGAVVAFDVLIVRPLGFVKTAVGALAFVPVALVTAPNGWDGVQTAQEIFIEVPGKDLFQRPLGDF